LLPILPFGALLVARVFCDDFNHPRPARILTRFGFYLVSAVLLIGLTTALLPPHFRPGRLALYPPTPDLPMLIALLVPAVVLCAMALIQPDSRRLRFRALVAVAFGFMFYLYVFALPAADEFRGERPFAEGVRETLHGDLSHLVIYKIWGPGLVFYLGNSAPIPAYDSADELTKDSNARWIIALERDLSSLPQNGRTVLHELVFPWEDSAGHRSKYALVEFSQAKR
jgi:hypothetical protein